MVSESASLPGVSDVSDGLSFFESDVGEVFNDIGDIWGDDNGLEWDFELDAALFGDPDVAEGLPVNRPDRPQGSGMTMTGLAQAVRDEEDRLSKLGNEKSGNKHGSEESKQAIWSFDGFSQSSVEPPARHAIKRDKDTDLLDILDMKPAKSVDEVSSRSVGFSPPKFPVIEQDVLSTPAPKKKRRTPARKSKPKSLPVGSMTGNFLDLMPEKKPSENKAQQSSLLSGLLGDAVSEINTSPSLPEQEIVEGVTPAEDSMVAEVTEFVKESPKVDEVVQEVGALPQVAEDNIQEDVVEGEDGKDLAAADEGSADVEDAPQENSDVSVDLSGEYDEDIFSSSAQFIPFDDIVDIIDEEAVAPKKEKTFLPPLNKKGWPTNRRGRDASPDAVEIEIVDDLEDMEAGMSHFTSKDWGDA